jgi:hypothetical protein
MEMQGRDGAGLAIPCAREPRHTRPYRIVRVWAVLGHARTMGIGQATPPKTKFPAQCMRERATKRDADTAET